MKSHWLMVRRLPSHGLWITTGKYTFEEVIELRLDYPACPLADVQAEDISIVREIAMETLHQ